jgi:hypothetical protein
MDEDKFLTVREALELCRILDGENLAYELTGWRQTYRGPGLGFSSDPYYIMGRTRVLVKQLRGLDI